MIMVDRKYRNFELAREYAQSLELKSNTEWEKYCHRKRNMDEIQVLHMKS
jgi:hypothetical protein